MQNSKFLIGALVVIIVIGLGWWFTQNNGGLGEMGGEEVVPEESAEDVVLDFYVAWLDAAASSTATPGAAELLASSVLSDAVRAYVGSDRESAVEPLLCQTVLPERIRASAVQVAPLAAQYQIFARGEGLVPGEYALVDVIAVDGAWQIANVGCFSGESAPDREFTFEQSGQLLKSVPAPLNADMWHLVFMENNEPRIVPMTFTPTTMCLGVDEVEAVCVPDTFTEAARAVVTGNMTEAGVTVVRVQL